jgi:two-component system, cell cycle response regulator
MSHRARVIAADDGEIERQLLTRVLQHEGYDLNVVADGLSAIAEFQTSGADLILMDWMMPGIDGIETIRRIRALDVPVQPFIIMLTARIDRDDAVAALSAGADDYVTKPFDRRELLTRIRNGVRTQLLLRDLTRTTSLLRHMAMTDALTGLPNRRAFEEWLTEVQTSAGADRPVMIALADLDRFKSVNDMHGHLAGDRVLVEVGERLRAVLPADALVARYGGDEFMIGLTSRTRTEAETILDRACTAVERPAFDLGDRGAVEVGISAGLAILTEADDIAGLLTTVDRELYRAKRRRQLTEFPAQTHVHHAESA